MKQILFTFFVLSLLITISKGQWSEQTSGVTTTLYSVSAVNDDVAWACGASGRVLMTTNGGTNWTSVVTPNATLNLYHIYGASASIALVTGSTTNTFVYRTTDGGSTWSQVFTQTGGFIDAIVQRGLNPQHFIMMGDPVGGRWSIWLSTDNGATWDSTGIYLPQAGSEAGWNNSMAATADVAFRFWFGTSNTRVYYKAPGPTFIFQTQPTTGLANSSAIWFNDNAKGMVGGTSMQYTTNSGANWSPITTSGTGDISGITGAGSDWWYVRGTGIYYSSNNGLIWSTDYTAPSGSHQHISKSRTGNVMWAVRTAGGIAKSLGPIGIEPISSEIPKSYSLYQNFPNPFNPSTTIRFDISKESFVKITVFDETGREVSRLVNENLRAGKYEIHWAASMHASGMYFYKLESAGFVETKKMVLIK